MLLRCSQLLPNQAPILRPNPCAMLPALVFPPHRVFDKWMPAGRLFRHRIVPAVALLLTGCTSSFDNAGTPAPIYTQAPRQEAPTPVESYQRNASTTPAQKDIEVADLPALESETYTVVPPNYNSGSLESTTQSAIQNTDAATLIQRSRSNYSGNCACPYDTDRAGRSCGKRSAYSRAGGASVLCYASDVAALKQPGVYSKTAPISPSLCGGSSYGSISCTTGLPRTNYVRGYYRSRRK